MDCFEPFESFERGELVGERFGERFGERIGERFGDLLRFEVVDLFDLAGEMARSDMMLSLLSALCAATSAAGFIYSCDFLLFEAA